MTRFLKVCPECYSSSVKVKMGGGGFVEDGIMSTDSDMGEVYECPVCRYRGADVIHGNEALLGFLKDKREIFSQRQKSKARVAMQSKQ